MTPETSDTVMQALGVLQAILEYAGTIAFGISGALAAGRKSMDLVGVVALGAIVAVGGGTIRDMLLGNQVFWVSSPAFFVVGMLTAIAAIPLFRIGALDRLERYNLVEIFDAAGMAIFVITGTNVALNAGASNVAALFIGVISGVGGGIIRDVLAGDIPSVLAGGQFYATAAFFGAALYVGLLQLPVSPLIVVWFPIAMIFGVRALSLTRGWKIPTFRTVESD